MEENPSEEEPDSSSENNLQSTIKAATGLVREIPIYQDAIQPAAKQIGKSLETVTKLVNLSLAPIKVMVWGYEQIENFLVESLAEQLKSVPEDRIQSPPPEIAVPAIESLRYHGENKELRKMFSRLISQSMDENTADRAHPAYVNILNNLAREEGEILKLAFRKRMVLPVIDIQARASNNSYYTRVANYSHLHKKIPMVNPNLTPTYLDNLKRLGLIDIPMTKYLTEPNTYEPLEDDPEMDSIKEEIISKGRTIKYVRKIAHTTSFGRQFLEIVTDLDGTE